MRPKRVMLLEASSSRSHPGSVWITTADISGLSSASAAEASAPAHWFMAVFQRRLCVDRHSTDVVKAKVTRKIERLFMANISSHLDVCVHKSYAFDKAPRSH